MRGSRSSRAHPRSRGENPGRRCGWVGVEGSSPLTRGKHQKPDNGACNAGLIPAHAGKTARATDPALTKWAHPRSRGENHTTPRGPRTPVGSSPLTRGKRSGRARSWLARRLIPTHAGKTSIVSSRFMAWRAHPRSRGENNVEQDWISFVRGSSPLTRGKLHAELLGEIDNGLIPAHAGKTSD